MTNIRNTEWFSEYRSCIEQGDLQNAKKVLLRNISNDDVIYKYQRGTNRNWNCIAKGKLELWLSQAGEFNDPFDCAFLYNHHSKEIHKITKKKFVVVGVRIHAMNISNQQKREEFNTVLESVKYDENVMIVGDFNNYRRGFDDSYWCLSKIDELATKEGFSMYTPQGGSIYKDNDGDYSFPEDHIFIKGQLNINTCKYERSLFTNRDTTVYKWKTDFQKYRGKDKNGEYLYDNIDDPFPDHAIIEADFDIK